ncbi:hypothetical protein ACJX0J_013531, partial [Zea mays]
MAQWFIPWFGQVQHLPTPRCGVPMDEGCNQPLSSDAARRALSHYCSVLGGVADGLNLKPSTSTDQLFSYKRKNINTTENHLVDIFTKPLDEKRFCRLRSELNVLDSLLRRMKGWKTLDIQKEVTLHLIGPSKVKKETIEKIINN